MFEFDFEMNKKLAPYTYVGTQRGIQTFASKMVKIMYYALLPQIIVHNKED